MIKFPSFPPASSLPLLPLLSPSFLPPPPAPSFLPAPSFFSLPPAPSLILPLFLQSIALLQRNVKSLEDELGDARAAAEESRAQEAHWRAIKYATECNQFTCSELLH